MRKLSSFMISIALTVTCCTLPVFAGVPAAEDIAAEAAILMDAETGQVLYEKDPHSRRHPASITKIMTALLVLEHLRQTDIITASESAVDLPSWSSSAYLQEDEQLTVEQTMYAMMLRSGNDAANVLAEAVAGSVSNFATLMNTRAAEIGAVNTTFSNPHGLPQRNHLTTAYDMALITRAAMQTPGFLAYFGTDSYSMPATNKNDARIFTNTHRMLLQDYAQYEETVIGGKTGYTMPSGYTLVTVSEQEGRTLICVVLNSETIYADTKALLDFGFHEFTPITYTLEDVDTPLSVSIWDGDWEAGRAYLSAPKSTSVLLHDSIDVADLSTSYQYPESPGVDDEIEGYISINLPGGDVTGLPETLLSVPLEVDMVSFDPPAVETMTLQADGSLANTKPDRSIAPLLIGVALVGTVLFINVTLVRRYKRRKQRRYYRGYRTYR